MRVIITGLLFSAISTSALAQDNNACVQAVQPQVDDFARCEIAKPIIAADTSRMQAATAVEAVEACSYFPRGLYLSFMDFPCYQDNDQAESSVKGVLDRMRKDPATSAPSS